MGQEDGEEYHKVYRWAGMCRDESLGSELWETASELPHLSRAGCGSTAAANADWLPTAVNLRGSPCSLRLCQPTHTSTKLAFITFSLSSPEVYYVFPSLTHYNSEGPKPSVISSLQNRM